jgi:hypothetical protein
MSIDMRRTLTLPEAPDHRLLEPSTPEFEIGDTVTIYGYIGKVTDDYIQLHHAFDYRTYYQIPIEGIVSCQLDETDVPELKNLYELQIHEWAPLRFYHVTTVEMTARALADAVRLDEEELELVDAEIKARGITVPTCRPDCPPGFCRQGVCVKPPGGFPLNPVHVTQFGLNVSIPKY